MNSAGTVGATVEYRHVYEEVSAQTSVYARRVTAGDLLELEHAISHGHLPWDLEFKLRGLACGGFANSGLEQYCRIFAALLQSAENEGFDPHRPHTLEHLLMALAYVRKDDDVIPDWEPSGYSDDYRFVKAIANESREVIVRYKSWRLRNQVPRLWAQ